MLQSIHIEHFKVLRNEDFNFSNLTLIAGLNSMGKSTLVQALLALRQSHERNPSFIKGLFLSDARYVNLGFGKDVLSSDEDNEYFIFDIVRQNGKHLHLKFNYSSTLNVQPLCEVEEENGFDDTFSLFTNRFQYISAERLSPRSLFPIDPYEVNVNYSLGKNGQYTVHYIAENQLKPIPNKTFKESMLSKKGMPRPKSDTLLSYIEAWVSEITPGVRIVANVIEDIGQASLHYQFETKDGYTEKFKPENVGFGLTYALPVITAVLMAIPGDLLIIENPEAHLHPSGQSAMGRLFSIAVQTGVQIITETHSDHFLNGVRVAVKNEILDRENVSVYYLQRSKDNPAYAIESVQPYIDKNGRLDEWPDGFFDEWDKQIDELLK